MVQQYQTDEENQPQALGWTPGPQFWANRGPKSISKSEIPGSRYPSFPEISAGPGPEGPQTGSLDEFRNSEGEIPVGPAGPESPTKNLFSGPPGPGSNKTGCQTTSPSSVDEFRNSAGEPNRNPPTFHFLAIHFFYN